MTARHADEPARRTGGGADGRADPGGAWLARLPGRWEGTGAGHYPTIEPFTYTERLTFTRLGDRPVLRYDQATAGPDGAPLHVETGWLRVGPSVVALLITQPTGFAEVHHAPVAATLELSATGWSRAAGALPVTTARRRWALTDGRLVTELWMTYDGHVDAHHLRAELTRTGDAATVP